MPDMALDWRRARGEAALLHAVREHIVHHARFYTATVLGVAVWALTEGLLPPELRFVAAGDAAFVLYLVTMAILAGDLTTLASVGHAVALPVLCQEHASGKGHACEREGRGG